MSTVASRIKLLRLHLGLTQEQFGQLASRTKPAVSSWERGLTVPGWDSLQALLTARNINPHWIIKNQGEMFLPPSDHRRIMEESADFKDDVESVSNSSPGPDVYGHVPLVSWVQAGAWSEAVERFTLDDNEAWIACAVSHGPRTFALRVQGDSMTSPHGLSIPHGTLIFVDPDQRGCVASGSLVVAKLNSTNDVTFKRLVEDAGRCFLQPLNPQYPTIHDEFQVIGLVLGAFQDFRHL